MTFRIARADDQRHNLITYIENASLLGIGEAPRVVYHVESKAGWSCQQTPNQIPHPVSFYSSSPNRILM